MKFNIAIASLLVFASFSSAQETAAQALARIDASQARLEKKVDDNNAATVVVLGKVVDKIADINTRLDSLPTAATITRVQSDVSAMTQRLQTVEDKLDALTRASGAKFQTVNSGGWGETTATMMPQPATMGYGSGMMMGTQRTTPIRGFFGRVFGGRGACANGSCQ